MVTINWINNKNIGNKVSMLEFINKDASSIRGIFFKLISNFGNFNILNKPLYAHFIYKNIQSMWIMSLIHEKSHYKSKYLDDILKIIAFKKYIEKENPNEILLENSNSKTFKTLKKYCNLNNIKLYEKNSINKTESKIYEFLPNFVQASTWIIKIYFDHSKLKIKKNTAKNSEIFICSYFSHLKNDKIKKGNYSSEYWDGLAEIFISNNIKVEWVHHFIKTKITPNTKTANNILNSINAKENNSHNFITSHLSFRLLVKIILGYVNFRFQTLLVRTSFENIFYFDGIDFKEFFKNDFKKSIYGIVAIENIMWIEIFNKLLKELPKQKLGIYLQENQGWEYAFINAWKNNGHGKLLAVQHSSVAYWDMRYLNSFDSKLFLKSKQFKPDFFSVNGDLSKKQFLKFEYPKQEIIDLEALRYRNIKKLSIVEKTSKKILILGDISYSITSNLLKIIYPIVRNGYKWYFKSHPIKNYEIDKDFKKHISELHKPLSQLISDFDTIICSDSSTVSIESLMSGLKTIVVNSDAKLNRSALKDEKVINFVNTTEDINKSLSSFNNYNSSRNYFYQSEDLYRWNTLLERLNILKI